MNSSPRASILVDTNVLLDVLRNRQPFADASEKILNLCESGVLRGRISDLSIPNIAYIMHKELDQKTIEMVVDSLDLAVGIEDLQSRDIKEAASMHWKDFEDAIQTTTAMRINANFIVTRNVRDFEESPVQAIAPDDFLREFNLS